MAIKKQLIVADFETTTDPEDCRVWVAGAVDIETLETVHVSNSIDTFMEWLAGKNTVCYFHNLKFDGEFILSWLLRNGFTYSDRLETKTFKSLITAGGLFYSITVCFQKQNKKYKKVIFYDSLKKLPFKVETIAKAFELKFRKLSIDYDAPRPVGHELTPEEREYLKVDCRIVAEALQIQLGKGLKKMTNASDALNGYKNIVERRFDYWFPVLPLELDKDIRRAYKGGYVYLQPWHKNRRGLRGVRLDVNSLYPWTMHECLLPYGYPIYFEGEPEENEDYPLFIVRLSCSFKLKPGHLPTIQLKNNLAFNPTEYLTDSRGEITELTMTNVDLALFLEHYDTLNLEYIKGWRFRGASGMFTEYIDYWMHIKETTTGAMRQLAKLMLNSLYGKFATNPLPEFNRVKEAVLDSEGVVRYKVNEPEREMAPVYTAMGAFITAYAREKTIRSAQSVFDRFIYADTDSLHLIGEEPPEGLEIHPTKLGAWKNEGVFTDSKYIRAKTYMETMHETKKNSLKTYCELMQNNAIEWVRREGDTIHYGKNEVVCAGMPDNVKALVNYENFAVGSTFNGKLLPRRVPGGIVLEPTTFTIK